MAIRKAADLDLGLPQFCRDMMQGIEEKHAMQCVVIMGAILENSLMTLLHKFFIKCPATDGLFDIKGDLCAYSKCARMAYCLGLVSKPMWKNLKSIGLIRNHFAHATKGTDFKDTYVAGLCDDLTIPDIPKSWESANDWQMAAGGAQFKYITVCSFLTAAIMNTAKSVKRLEEAELGGWKWKPTATRQRPQNRGRDRSK